jgi:hypothetical protein
MVKPYPHRHTADGRDYACGNCGAVLPDGVMVEGHWTAADKLTGVRAVNADGQVVHECGTKPARGEGGHG